MVSLKLSQEWYTEVHCFQCAKYKLQEIYDLGVNITWALQVKTFSFQV